jgi:hypothetical protein
VVGSGGACLNQKLKNSLMILANGNVDEKSYAKVDAAWLMELIGDLTTSNLYISLVARDEDIKSLVRKTKDGIFLRLILPYQDILAAEDAKAIIINTLLEELHRLERYKGLVDVEGLREGIKARFGKEVMEVELG